MTNKILEREEGTRLVIMAPVVHGEKGTHKDLLDDLRKQGFVRVRVNGEMHDLTEEITLEKNKKSNIEVIVDRIVLKDGIRSRLFESLEVATKLSNGKVVVDFLGIKKLFTQKTSPALIVIFHYLNLNLVYLALMHLMEHVLSVRAWY